MDKVFIDTAAWLALINKDDEFHKKAKDVRENLIKDKTILVTTNQVIIEVANSLSKSLFRESAIKLIESIEMSRNIRVIYVEQESYTRAWKTYKKMSDKAWSLTDCISFVVMEDEGVQKAFTTDHHFEQAGFIKLL